MSGHIDAMAEPKRPLYRTLHVQVLLAVVLGSIVGLLDPELGIQLKPLGDGFVKLVKMMIPPVVFCTIATGITSLGDGGTTGRTLLKALALFYALTIVALLLGLGAAYIGAPGVGLDIDPTEIDPSVAAHYTDRMGEVGFTDFLLRIIPKSFFAAFTEGEVLPVLLIALLVGCALAKVGPRGATILRGIQSFTAVVFAVFGFLVRLAPVGAFGAMAFTVGRYGAETISSLGLLIATFYGACLVFVFVVLGSLCWTHRFGFFALLRYIRAEILIVLGCSSSGPVLPLLLRKLERLGCRKEVVGIVLPAGYSFNLVGTAIYLTLASVFITQAMNIELSTTQLVTMILIMLLTSKGAAGVTGSGFVALVATLTVLPEIPVTGVAIIFGIDRFMSEARALVSAIANTVAVVVVSLWQGACDREVLRRELARGSDQSDEYGAPW
ncbi:MAG: C4-dicarboxylate transporter DctA [Myxococcota bacterium]